MSGDIVFLMFCVAYLYFYVKFDPIHVSAWQCKSCHCIYGGGSFRRSKLARAQKEHQIWEPTCSGELEPIDYARTPFIY